MEDSIKRQESSHIAEHMMTSHPEMWSTDAQRETSWRHFKLEVAKSHTSSFIRQLHEAVTIMMQPGCILNDVTEYNRCIVPSLEVSGGKT